MCIRDRSRLVGLKLSIYSILKSLLCWSNMADLMMLFNIFHNFIILPIHLHFTLIALHCHRIGTRTILIHWSNFSSHDWFQQIRMWSADQLSSADSIYLCQPTMKLDTNSVGSQLPRDYRGDKCKRACCKMAVIVEWQLESSAVSLPPFRYVTESHNDFWPKL